MSHKTQIAGANVSTDGIMLIRPYSDHSIFDVGDLPFLPQAIVHIRDKGQRPAKRTVQELAHALGFVTVATFQGVVALNPAYAHYSVTQIQEDERTRRGQQTKIAWKVDGQERSVYVNESVEEVLALLPKVTEHIAKAAVLTAGRPHHVREIKPTEPGTDVT